MTSLGELGFHPSRTSDLRPIPDLLRQNLEDNPALVRIILHELRAPCVLLGEFVDVSFRLGSFNPFCDPSANQDPTVGI